MKKTYKLSNLDCPACADKIERKILKLSGIKEVHLNFIIKKASIEADSEEVFDKSEKIIKMHAGDFEKE
ncbi:MAG: heavy-metal-associated domain-containing protein [Clostridiaceae bacterium]|nr:heavy-metal-associated domain-containing protein [Clostridiaceae bacterium]